MAIKPRGNQNKIGVEMAAHRFDHPTKTLRILVIAKPAHERKIYGVPFPVIHPHIVRGTGPGVMRILMNRYIQNTTVRTKTPFGPVAMMDIPIHYKYPTESVGGLKITRADRHVIKKTKTHRALGLGMMPRRPHHGKPVVHRAVHYLIEKFEETSRGKQCCIVGFAKRMRVGIESSMRLSRCGADVVDVYGVMNQRELIDRRRARCDADKPVSGVDVNQLDKSFDPLRTLRVGGCHVMILITGVEYYTCFEHETMLPSTFLTFNTYSSMVSES